MGTFAHVYVNSCTRLDFQTACVAKVHQRYNTGLEYGQPVKFCEVNLEIWLFQHNR